MLSATQKEFVEVLLRLRVIIYTILSVLVGQRVGRGGGGESVVLCFSLKSKDLILSLPTNAFHSLLSKCNCVFNTKQKASWSWRFDD